MEPNVFDKVQDVDLKKTMENSYIDYAMSVIVSRAIPDIRDGLKPVQRRVLYSLQTLGVTPDKKTKKCATIVGECMGKFHPHVIHLFTEHLYIWVSPGRCVMFW